MSHVGLQSIYHHKQYLFHDTVAHDPDIVSSSPTQAIDASSLRH
jgi:hypothetical protein